jgi:hypothetical protein
MAVRRFLYLAAAGAALFVPLRSDAQTAQDVAAISGPVTVEQKWQFFLQETGSMAMAKRFGAASVDNVTQNFFSDFVMASLLHEDTKYRRRGEQYGFRARVGYAISRAVVTRTDTGASTVNWSNLTGTALSVGLSNAYYPARSRNLNATAINWGASASGVGFANLFPEFLPDFKRWLKRHHL